MIASDDDTRGRRRMSHETTATTLDRTPDPTRSDAHVRTPANTPTRGGDRATWDREVVAGILDATPVCHLSYVDDRVGGPITIPTSFSRVGDDVVFHSSSGAHVAALARDPDRDGGPGQVSVCVTVTLVDGWVLARSGMHHSMNYRAVVVRGNARLVADEAGRRAGLAAVLDAVWPGRSEHCRPPDARELAATAVFRLPLEVVSAKVRAEGAVDDHADLDGPWWAGIVPVRTVIDEPIPNADLAPGIHLPTT